MDHAAYMRSWRIANPEKEKEIQRKARKKYVLMLRYGITPEEKLDLFEASDGLCASCYEEPATHIDHDHASGKVRGALCAGCNQGLGNFKDNPERLLAAASYLARKGGE